MAKALNFSHEIKINAIKRHFNSTHASNLTLIYAHFFKCHLIHEYFIEFEYERRRNGTETKKTLSTHSRFAAHHLNCGTHDELVESLFAFHARPKIQRKNFPCLRNRVKFQFQHFGYHSTCVATFAHSIITRTRTVKAKQPTGMKKNDPNKAKIFIHYVNFQFASSFLSFLRFVCGSNWVRFLLFFFLLAATHKYVRI